MITSTGSAATDSSSIAVYTLARISGRANLNGGLSATDQRATQLLWPRSLPDKLDVAVASAVENIVSGAFTPVLAKHKKPFSPVDRVSVGDSIRQEVEDSRRRLSVDAIDLYQVHWPPDSDFAELRSVSINLLFSPTAKPVLGIGLRRDS
jgi:hypothetical protein